MATLMGCAKIGRTAFFCCDIQQRFAPLIHKFPTVIGNSKFLIDTAKILSIPIIATEQNPRALGKTVDELGVLPEFTFSKMRCSMVDPPNLVNQQENPVDRFLTSYRGPNNQSIDSVVLFGIEAHVCILQTALTLIEKGLRVHVIADAISSRRAYDRKIAIERMKQSGIWITTSESIVFQILETADHPNFKAISNLMKSTPTFEAFDD
eukprot:TRINITY_DN424_c5_g1_i1.p1 TRINITY_DN424_c5_g1~~TRINITY_DN424_c5_g1_i1.p1  ORF type:complete len:208 (-),score=91.78 TRINITY_DN424_c5_g1_i1:314-937(-)